MQRPWRITALVSLLAPTAWAQTIGKPTEFEVAAIRPATDTGFHLAPDTGAGGPGTSDPGMFRCASCSLATLIARAFDLRNYQFPARGSLEATAFGITARVPAGASEEDFRLMLQNLLRERFGLTSHFETRSLRGYRLVAAPNGPKLTESGHALTRAVAPPSDSHWGGHDGDHAHNGVVLIFGSARFRAEQQSMAEFARMLSDQISLPVDDRTGLTARYDISLSWAGDENHASNHMPGNAGNFHDHAGASPAPSRDDSGPTLFEALQSQLGLRLVPADAVSTRVLIIDHVEKQPTAN